MKQSQGDLEEDLSLLPFLSFFDVWSRGLLIPSKRPVPFQVFLSFCENAFSHTSPLVHRRAPYKENLAEVKEDSGITTAAHGWLSFA